MEAKCQNCSAKVYRSDSFCGSCGFALKEPAVRQVSVKTGKDSLNIGVGNLPGATIQVGNTDDVMGKVGKVGFWKKL